MNPREGVRQQARGGRKYAGEPAGMPARERRCGEANPYLSAIYQNPAYGGVLVNDEESQDLNPREGVRQQAKGGRKYAGEPAGMPAKERRCGGANPYLSAILMKTVLNSNAVFYPTQYGFVEG